MIMVKEFGLESNASAAEFQKYTENNSDSGLPNSVSKRIKLSLPNNQQGEDLNSYQQTNPIGLTLKKTPSFLNLLEMVLSQAGTKSDTRHPSAREHNEANMNNISCHQYGSEKLKASNFSALSIKIGSFERSSRYEEELIAKCYYAKKKIVWEVLEGPVKSKMEIQWSDIEAIRATIHENEPGILEIELNQPPLFFKETNPQPRKHTLWQPASDFTGGQAIKCRRHIVHFPSGTLDKHYEKLLKCDRRLLELTRKPFPCGRFPYFQHNIYPCNISFDTQQVNIPTSFVQTHHLNITNDGHLHGMDLQHQHEGDNVCLFNNQGVENCSNEHNGNFMENHIKVLPATFLPSNMQFTSPDTGNILATESSICSFVDSLDGVNNMFSHGFDENFMETNYYFQYGLTNPKEEQYEPLNTSYVNF